MPALSPTEVFALKGDIIPEQVFEIVNSLLAKRMASMSTQVIIKQNEVVEEIIRVMGVQRHEVFANGWLYFEQPYRDQGWTVTYDKPGYNEEYEAYFKFEPARKR